MPEWITPQKEREILSIHNKDEKQKRKYVRDSMERKVQVRKPPPGNGR